MSYYDALICADCEWTGDIHELVPMEDDDFGNERCPECGSLDIGERHLQEARADSRADESVEVVLVMRKAEAV